MGTVFVIALVCSTGHAAAQERQYYYYGPDGRGAHAFHNPQNFIVQGGLGALYEERLDTFDWIAGFSTVNYSLSQPVKVIGEYGWGRLFYREFVPHLGPGQNYVPNWVWHFMGGGMRTKLMEEYYTHHGLKHPRIWAWLTMYAYHYLNEAVQAERFKDHHRSTVDPLPDMYFFDWAGAVLFRFDRVNRYMSGKLHMREWSYQAQWNPLTMRLINNGQLYWLRRKLYGPVSLSFLTGEQISSLNLTVGFGQGQQLSLGLGPKSKAFIAQKNGDTDPSGIVWATGLFYSVDDNPFVTVTFEPRGGEGSHGKTIPLSETGRCILNIYPGTIDVFGIPLGMSVVYQRSTLFVGWSFGLSPAGLALTVPRGNEVLNGATQLGTRAQTAPR